MLFISDTKTLSDFCDTVSGSDFICVDTEFIREKTYWSQLCLIQVADENNSACIDPLAEGIDLAPFLKLMQNPDVLKVFHSARQDIEIFFNMTEAIPTPLFDTQVAAMVCGFGNSIGYKNLVNKLANIELDKTARFSDWARRPLTEKQLSYAISDVTHLRVVYKKLQKQLEKSGRYSWLKEEMAVLTTPETYINDPYKAWEKIKTYSQKPQFLAILREVTAWREKEAQNKDCPRKRIVRDEVLVEIASNTPATTEELARIRTMSKGMAEGRYGKALLEAVDKGINLPKEEWPKKPKNKKKPAGNASVEELLKVLLKIKCEEHKVAPRLIASTSDLEEIAAYNKPDVPALKGWRKKLFGNDAIKLKNGQIALSYDVENMCTKITEIS